MKVFIAAMLGLLATAGTAHAASILEQLSPSPFAYSYGPDYGTPGEIIDGTRAFGPTDTDVTAQIFRLTGGAGVSGLSSGCAAGDYGSGIAGSIVLLSRGDCAFVQKTAFAQQAGALAILIADNDPANISFDMSGFDPSVQITAFRLSYTLGELLAAQTLTTPTTIRVALGDNLVSHLTPAVPEPAAWAMMITGFALVGGQLRARKSAARHRALPA